MKETLANKETIIKSVAKMAADKELVRAYIKGEVSGKTLTQKGIKFAKPL